VSPGVSGLLGRRRWRTIERACRVSAAGAFIFAASAATWAFATGSLCPITAARFHLLPMQAGGGASGRVRGAALWRRTFFDLTIAMRRALLRRLP